MICQSSWAVAPAAQVKPETWMWESDCLRFQGQELVELGCSATVVAAGGGRPQQRGTGGRLGVRGGQSACRSGPAAPCRVHS